jgi:hypothetical protein
MSSMSNDEFSKMLSFEMAEFRRSLLVRICRQRGYVLDNEKISSLLANSSMTLQQVLIRAYEMDAEKIGFLDRLWRRVTRKT